LKITRENVDEALSAAAALCVSASAKAEPAFQEVLNTRMSATAFSEAGEAAEAAVGNDVRSEIHVRLNDLCDFYLGASNAQRDYVREFVDIHRSLRLSFFDHSGWCLEQVKTPHDTEWLRRALMALLLDDGFDFRDTFVALGEIYTKAHRLGISIDDELLFAASIASKAPRGTNHLDGGMKKFLKQFKESAFFQQDVRPKLAKT